MEAARSDAPDAFQGLFAALEEACHSKRLSVDAGNFAVVSRSFAAAREVGACADDAAPFRGAAPADVSEACLRSLDAHAATERLGALEDFGVEGRERGEGALVLVCLAHPSFFSVGGVTWCPGVG